MSFEIKSRVVELETGRGVAGVLVEAYDADVLHDDHLGTARVDESGVCRIPVKRRFMDLDCPDVYLVVKSDRGLVLATTRGAFLRDVKEDISIEVPIPCFRLLEAGVITRGNLPPGLREVKVPESMRTLTLNDPADANDPVAAQIEKDRAGAPTLLAMLRSYMESVRTSADNQAPAFDKLHKLFMSGRDLPAMEGHHYGVALGLRVSGESHPLSQIDNVVGLLWGATLQDQSPWVGKSFRRTESAVVNRLTGQTGSPPFLGINHFNQLAWKPVNSISFHALTFWLNLEDVPAAERSAYGHERNGGNFIAGPGPSVCADTPRQVFSLNYRWPGLANRPPISWLIDEMVQIGDGLFLGQLLFAGKRLLGRFDPKQPAAAYDYRHMGYFALWDQRWNAEARRLFPFLDIPVTAPGLVEDLSSIEVRPAKQELALDDRPPKSCDDRVFAEVRADLAGRETVLHLMRDYADELQTSQDNKSPVFTKLGELFNRAEPVAAMNGFYRGALVSWRGAGLMEIFSKNAIELAYSAIGARFSTWTGKDFNPITRDRLLELTGGVETGVLPSAFGSNTQALRTMNEREVGRLMRLADIWCEPASQTESIEFGYDIKNFFFIGHAGISVNANCPDKRIYQINYRWPGLRTIPPDCFCMDEMVRLTQGLYLGQLMYATVLTPYDPATSPDHYRYGMFGYFLLMDEEWHRVRLRMGFDLENA